MLCGSLSARRSLRQPVRVGLSHTIEAAQEAGMGDVVRMRRRERREAVAVIIEAAVGYEDAEERWMRALDVLAEYAPRADDTKENET